MNLDNPELFWIDNDHGLLLKASDVQERIRSGRKWLYAKE
jgi:hypothetical protein